MTNTMLTTLIHRSESEKAILECGAKHRFGSPAGDGHNARARLTQLEVTGHSIQSAAARRTPKAPPYPRASTLGARSRTVTSSTIHPRPTLFPLPGPGERVRVDCVQGHW